MSGMKSSIQSVQNSHDLLSSVKWEILMCASESMLLS